MKLLLLPFPHSPSPPIPFLLLKGICGNCCRECPCVVPSAPFPHYSLSSPLAEAPGAQGHGGLGPGCHHLLLDPLTSPVCQTDRSECVRACVHACVCVCACLCVPVRVCLGLRICGARGRQGCIGRGPAVPQEPFPPWACPPRSWCTCRGAWKPEQTRSRACVPVSVSWSGRWRGVT